MYGSYASTDYGGFSQELENRHQDYANRVATTQERNIGRKTQDFIDAQSIFAEGKAVKTQGAELLAGTAPAVAGVYKGLKSVRGGIQSAREYVSDVKQKVGDLAKDLSDRRIGTVTGDEAGIEMEGTATSSQAAYDNAMDEGAADSSNSGGTSTLEAGEDDVGETPSALSATTGEVGEVGEGAAEVAEGGVMDAIGIGADFLAGPLGLILGGVALYEGIKEFADGTAQETSGSSARLADEKEINRPNIQNQNYSGKYVAPVPQVV